MQIDKWRREGGKEEGGREGEEERRENKVEEEGRGERWKRVRGERQKEEIRRRSRKRERDCPGTSWDLISGEGNFWVNGHPGKLVNVLRVGRSYTAR